MFIEFMFINTNQKKGEWFFCKHQGWIFCKKLVAKQIYGNWVCCNNLISTQKPCPDCNKGVCSNRD